MALRDRLNTTVATATAAIFATDCHRPPESVARIAGIAVATEAVPATPSAKPETETRPCRAADLQAGAIWVEMRRAWSKAGIACEYPEFAEAAELALSDAAAALDSFRADGVL